ncbi:hypothetical protein [Nodularia spumigena]|uniref:hypothetical protein n=1 Tax=Nodularia spumigena TaxID=70799 RepID=UPI002B1F090F|nr:hypothetical protein [Nodularia spumigena]MEA5557692.1 hypothetical protein [Nodularia spumigena CH309]
MSSEQTQGHPTTGAAPTNGFKFFLPGLIIGFILGAVVGALVPPFVNRGNEPLAMPSGQGNRPATDRERYETETPVVPDEAPGEATVPDVDPETPVSDEAGGDQVGG